MSSMDQRSEYFDTAVRLLQDRLEDGQLFYVSFRPGFDVSPHQDDFREVLKAVEDRSGEWVEGSRKLDHLLDFVDRHIDDEVYVDWSLKEFDQLEVVEEEVYGHTQSESLILRLYEPGATKTLES